MRDRTLVVDCDIHNVVSSKRMLDFLPEPHRTRYASGGRGAGGLGYWNPNGVMRRDAVTEDGKRVEHSPEALGHYLLDEYGIDYGVLNPEMGMGLSPDPDYAAALARAQNDVVAEDWLPAEPRLRGSIVISPFDAAQAAEEIHRLGDHPGFVQVLMPSGARFPYGQRWFHPIYEAAVAHNLPVAIHPGSEGVGTSGAPTAAGYPTNYFEWHTGLVGSYLAHLISLVTEGVFQKYPELTFIMVEGGVSWVPPVLWRFDKNWKALRVSTPWLEEPPSAIIQRHIRLTTQPIEEPDRPEHLHQILGMFDAASMLMFATDYPHWDGDTPDFAARWLPDELRERVMGRNAAELYGLKEPVHA